MPVGWQWARKLQGRAKRLDRGGREPGAMAFTAATRPCHVPACRHQRPNGRGGRHQAGECPVAGVRTAGGEQQRFSCWPRHHAAGEADGTDSCVFTTMPACLLLSLSRQENIKTKHPQLLYESKLYKILAGGGALAGAGRALGGRGKRVVGLVLQRRCCCRAGPPRSAAGTPAAM